jgi:hypothetical protein
VDLSLALSQETAATPGKHRRNFRHKGERDFFGCFAPDVESGWREQVSGTRLNIERSIFAEPR